MQIAINRINTAVAWTRSRFLEQIWTVLGKNHINTDHVGRIISGTTMEFIVCFCALHVLINWSSSFTSANSSDDDNATKEVLHLTFVTSDQPVSEVNALSCSHDNLTSNYHSITFLKVPIATAESESASESESEFEMPENDEEDEEDDEKEKLSQVNKNYMFYSVLLCI